jgi:restriction system protein
MLLLPLFRGRSAPFASLFSMLSSLGWLAIGLGIVLLGLHQLFKTHQQKIESPDRAAASGGKFTPRYRNAPTERGSRTEPQWSRGSRKPDTSGARSNAAFDPRGSHQEPTTWSSDVFAAIEWRRFEAVCEALFAQAGFETKSQSHGADGGVDIWLYSRNAEGPVAVVQCKHWQGKAVGVKEMREFFGVMASHQLKRGTYATTSSYTPDAQQFAKANGINALDGAALMQLIARRTPEQQQALLAVALEGEYWRPTCASCGIKMVERMRSKDGAQFWGCTGYPQCKSRLPLAAAVGPQ